MWKRRIIWLCMIILSGILYLFVNGPATLAVLVSILVVPVVLCIQPWLCRKKIHGEILLSEICRKKEKITGKLCIWNERAILPVSARVQLVCQNRRTGEKRELWLETGVCKRHGTTLEFALSSDHCGLLSVSVASLLIQDSFGLTSVKGENGAEASALLLPELFETVISLSSSASAMLESEHYSRTMTGNDPGEMLSIREYIPGDSVKNIHWKLSQKMDRLLIRELGMPVVNQVLILLETLSAPDTAPAELDAMAEVFASVSNGLYIQGLEPWIGWRNPGSGELETRKITGREKLDEALGEILAIPFDTDGESVAGSLHRQAAQCSYAHLVVISPQTVPGLADFCNGSRITVLTPERNSGAGGWQQDGTNVIIFSSDGFTQELSRLEL